MQRMIEAVSQQYDEVYYKAQALFDKYNPCQMEVHSLGKLTCVAKSNPGQLCCLGCGYLSDDGCTVMCLGCKVSLCGGAGDHDEFRSKMHKIKRTLFNVTVVRGYGLLGIRASKEKVMGRLAKEMQNNFNYNYPKRRLAWNALDAKGM